VIEAELRTRRLELVAAGRDVVVDLSFWSRRLRDEYRRLLEPVGVVPQTVYVATDRATALRRVRARRGADADDVVLDAATAGRYYDQFEVPTADEGPLTVVDGRSYPARS